MISRRDNFYVSTFALIFVIETVQDTTWWYLNFMLMIVKYVSLIMQKKMIRIKYTRIFWFWKNKVVDESDLISRYLMSKMSMTNRIEYKNRMLCCMILDILDTSSKILSLRFRCRFSFRNHQEGPDYRQNWYKYFRDFWRSRKLIKLIFDIWSKQFIICKNILIGVISA